MRRTALIPLMLGLGAVLLTGATAVAATKSVSIQNYAFDPTSVSVHVGDTVSWTNNEPPLGATHTVTADGGTFDSGDLAPGNHFTFTFLKAGSFPYHCIHHTYMTGTITVTSSASPTPTPTHPRPKATATATAEPTVVPVSPTPTSSAKPSPRVSQTVSHPPSPSKKVSPPASPSTVAAADSSSSGGNGAALAVIVGLVVVTIGVGTFVLRAHRTLR